MADQIDYATQSMAIANGASLSTAIQFWGYHLTGLQIGATFTGASVTFTGSWDGVTYQPIYDQYGAEVSVQPVHRCGPEAPAARPLPEFAVRDGWCANRPGWQQQPDHGIFPVSVTPPLPTEVTHAPTDGLRPKPDFVRRGFVAAFVVHPHGRGQLLGQQRGTPEGGELQRPPARLQPRRRPRIELHPKFIDGRRRSWDTGNPSDELVP